MNEDKKHSTRVTHCLVIAHPSSEESQIFAAYEEQRRRDRQKRIVTAGFDVDSDCGGHRHM